MNIQRMILTTIAVIGVMVTVESCATGPTILEATPHKLELLIYWGNKTAKENVQDVERLGAEHCKKFDKVAGQISLSVNLNSPAGVYTIPCV